MLPPDQIYIPGILNQGAMAVSMRYWPEFFSRAERYGIEVLSWRQSMRLIADLLRGQLYLLTPNSRKIAVEIIKAIQKVSDYPKSSDGLMRPLLFDLTEGFEETLDVANDSMESQVLRLFEAVMLAILREDNMQFAAKTVYEQCLRFRDLFVQQLYEEQEEGDTNYLRSDEALRFLNEGAESQQTFYASYFFEAANNALLWEQSIDLMPLTGKPEFIPFASLIRRQTLSVLNEARNLEGIRPGHLQRLLYAMDELSGIEDAKLWVDTRLNLMKDFGLWSWAILESRFGQARDLLRE